MHHISTSLKNLLSFLLAFVFIAGFSQKYITVTTKTADELVRDVFIGSQNASCITVSNISVNGWQDYGNNPFSFGYFEKGTLPFDIEKGVILSTGTVQNAAGPNNRLLDDADVNWLGDVDLANALGNSPSEYLNATSLEFDFIANNTTSISFQYMFLSEEYRPNNCQYSDGFAFLIKKAGTQDSYTNIALVPGTNDPVTSLTINTSPNCPRNTEYFGGFNSTESPTAFDGQTKLLTAQTDVIPGETYHIKLVIADHLASSDRTGRYDSGVFLKAGSFIGKKDLGPDLLISTNNSICEGESKTIDATTPGATSYQWFKEGVLLPGETNALLQIPGLPGNSGNYEVKINLGGCSLTGSIKVEILEKALINYGNYSFCDNQLSGSVPINFTDLSNAVIDNFSTAYIPKYYLKQGEAETGVGTPLTNGWLLTKNTEVFIRVESAAGCVPVVGKITLAIGNKTPLLKNTFTESVCDDKRVGTVQVDLTPYINEFTDDNSSSVLFFASVADAKNNVNPISSLQILDADSQTFGIRVKSTNACPNVGEIVILKKTPNNSSVLEDKPICENATTTLDAGNGFDYYKWSTGEEGPSESSISNIGIGDYWVDLSSNGCKYRQYVKVTVAELPQITNVEVNGNTATVFVTGGNQPYEFSLDNITYKDSNVFSNVPRGLGTIYVRDAQNCKTITKEFLVLNLINVITPNADGKNDVLDYSDLSIKKDVKIEIFDRYGTSVFNSQNQPYLWDGKINGRVLPTGTYWYILNWIEPETNLPATYKGWVLLKNR